MDGSQQLIDKLKQGETVSFRPVGNSMTPRIKSKQLVTISPVSSPQEIEKGDVLYCKVRGNIYVHLCTAIRKNGDDFEFQISNNHGHVNGWTGFQHIYGKLTKVEE